MKYRKKPIEIEAIQFDDTADMTIKVQEFMDGKALTVTYENPDNPKLEIETLEGTMKASIGDYIIKGVQGEFYPCKLDIFHATYEAVE